MIFRRSISLFAAVSSSVAFAMGQAAPDPKADAAIPDAPLAPSMTEAEKAKVLEKVVQMQKDFERLKREVTANALMRFEGASASEGAAVDFYLNCQQIIKDRTPDISPPEQDAKNAKNAKAKVRQQIDDYQAAPGLATVLKTKLEYLVLTLEAPGMKDRGILVSKVRDMVGRAMNVVKTYAAPNADPIKKVPVVTSGKGKGRVPTAQVRNKEEDRARQQINKTMKQGVMGSVFAEAYNLNNYFKPAAGWSDSPINLDAVYTGFVLPWYHENKRGDLNMVWDEYLGHALALHRCEEDDFAFANWGVTGYKNLQWAKWLDLLQWGMNRSMALDELAKMVKENPTHPDVETWVQDLARVAGEIRLPQAPISLDPNTGVGTEATEAAK